MYQPRSYLGLVQSLPLMKQIFLGITNASDQMRPPTALSKTGLVLVHPLTLTKQTNSKHKWERLYLNARPQDKVLVNMSIAR